MNEAVTYHTGEN